MSRPTRGERWGVGCRRRRKVAVRSGCALLVFLLSWTASCSVAFAQSAAELQRQADAAGRELSGLRRGGELSAATEVGFVERLGRLALGFIDECDRATRAGTERKGTLRPVFEAIHEPLNAIYAGRNGRLERMARGVMDVDGDLEALYETRDWKESQRVAAQSLYYLNWLNYYGARLYDGRRRKDLLEAAERGFSEFAVGDRRTELLAESLLGRALCHLELGNYEWAIRDFGIVLEDSKTSEERKAKARLGTLEALVRSGKVAESLRYSQGLLDSGRLSRGDAAIVRFFRLETLFKAAKTAGPADAERYRRESLALMQELRRAGGGWAQKVDALMLTSIDDPGRWANKATTPFARLELARMLFQQGKELEAVPLLEDLLASQGAEADRYRAEANYLLGVARFKAGQYDVAADLLTAAVESGQSGSFGADAMYLRFKALEALMAGEPTPELAQRYEQALRAFLAQYPKHASAAEARYRLGEYLQAQREFVPAIDEYRQVAGDTALEVRAVFGILQSEFDLLREGRTRREREALAERIGADLTLFWERVGLLEKRANKGGVPLPEFEATVTLFQAAYLSLRGTDGDVEIDTLLAGFADRFPGQQNLLPQAARMRLGALQRLGRFAEAERLAREQAAVLAQDGRVDLVESLAQGFMKAATRRREQGAPEEAREAETVARMLFEALPDAVRGETKTKLTLARLCESTGELERAEQAYREVLSEDAGSVAAMRGLARVAEERRDLAQAAQLWKRFTETVRPGDRAWYEGYYRQAQIAYRMGESRASCDMLEELRPAMPGLSDSELRGQLNDLYQQACR